MVRTTGLLPALRLLAPPLVVPALPDLAAARPSAELALGLRGGAGKSSRLPIKRWLPPPARTDSNQGLFGIG